MACNKIEETSRKMEGKRGRSRGSKAIYDLIDIGTDKEDVNEEVLEEKLQNIIMEKFKK